MRIKRRTWILAAIVAGRVTAPPILFRQYVQCRRNSYVDPQSHRDRCRNNLNQIRKALDAYASENGGWYPPRLDDLAAYDPSIPEYFCPWARGNGRIGRYGYLRPRTKAAETPPNQPLAADFPGNHRVGGNLVFADGHVDTKLGGFNALVQPFVSAEEMKKNKLKWYQW